MKYSDGQEVKLGDKVKLGQDEGVVAFSIDTDEYCDDYPKEHWEYLKRGVMIEFPAYGLIYCEESESDLKFIARARPKNQTDQPAR